MNNYFIDTEFMELGPTQPIQLISIGIVCDDGREYYGEVDEFRHSDATPWLAENVVPFLHQPKKGCYWHSPTPEQIQQTIAEKCSCWENPGPRKSRYQLAQDIVEFMSPDSHPKVWAYFGSYDWVVFAQIWGIMKNLPKGYPYYCRDLKQWMDELHVKKEDLPSQVNKHNALSDARWNAQVHSVLFEKSLNGGPS